MWEKFTTGVSSLSFSCSGNCARTVIILSLESYCLCLGKKACKEYPPSFAARGEHLFEDKTTSLLLLLCMLYFTPLYF